MKSKTILSILSLALATPLWLAPLHAEGEAADPAPKKEKKEKKDKKKDKKAKDKAADEDTNYISTRIPGWTNPDAARRTLLNQIKNGLKGDSPENVAKFVEKPQNRLLVAQYMLAKFDALTPPDMAANSRKKLTDAIARMPGEIERDKEKLKTKLILQVHDELIFDVPEDEVDKMKELIPDIMANAYKMKTRLDFSLVVGKDWYEAK